MYRNSIRQNSQLCLEEVERRTCLSAVAFIHHELGIDGYRWGEFVDLDNDGDQDLITTYRDDNAAIWNLASHENIDGHGMFGPRQVIDNSEGRIFVSQTADLDGDGDQDLITASGDFERTIAWYENLDGEGRFGPRRMIDTDHYAWVAATGDLDGDGDLDLIAHFTEPDEIAWYENADGQGTFGRQRQIAYDGGSDSHRRSVALADLDDDGDQDLISSFRETDLNWHENTDGQGTFGPPKGVSRPPGEDYAVAAADLDRDGDQDIIYSSDESSIAWTENTDARGAFDRSHHIVKTERGEGGFELADLDNDGDIDVISDVSLVGDPGGVWWYENDGSGSFGTEHLITNSKGIEEFVAATDLDGDGDQDLIAWMTDDSITWYENRQIGDSNDDGVFNSRDLVYVFAVGKYEDGIPDNATFDDGDWNQNGDFDSSDLLLALQAGHYEIEASSRASEIAASKLQ